jgi:hypothetical protein
MYSDSISLQSQTKQSHAQKFDNHATSTTAHINITIAPTPQFIAVDHGDASLRKIRFHQIEHLHCKRETPI